MSGLVESKVAVITGAARGIGEQTARLFSAQGASVCLWDVRSTVREVAESISRAGADAVGFEVDITKGDLVRKAARDVLARHGRIDILVNCAGIAGPSVEFVEMDDDSRDTVLAVNLLGTANCCKAVLPSMVDRRSGRIVNISSVTGPVTIIPGSSAYAASKGAVSALTKALAVEVAQHGITVNAVLPGTVVTPLLIEAFAAQGMDPLTEVARLEKKIPMGRAGKPEDIAGACLLLASEFASYITGVELIVDGGFHLPEWG